MKKVSFEYCHIYPGLNEKEEIDKANEWAPRVFGMFKDCNMQKCMMIDDLHATRKIDDEFIKWIVGKLKLKPDCIYLESEFVFEAHKMIEAINPKERDFIISDEKTWLRENVQKFRTTTEFLLSWKNKQGKTEFSCPSLAATSYLTRLGHVKGDGVKTIYGEKLMADADYVVNLLSSKYLQVEDKAQSIVEASFKEALRKIGWYFF